MKLVAFSIAIALASPAAAETHLLLVASNEGAAEEPALSFAESDAERVAAAFLDVGAVAPSRVERILGRRAGDVEIALELLRRRVRSDDTVIIFVSAHGGQDGMHLAGDVLAWGALRRAIEALPARLAVAFVDACRSGALLTAKGTLVRGPPLSVSALPSGPAGHVLITSSGADELSTESVELGGSAFAQLLASAIRGSADADGDGAVTLAEAYAQLYARTVAATLSTPVGPQHPTARFSLHGAGNAVLSRRAADASALARRAAGASDCYVLDADEIAVLAELPRDRVASVQIGARAVVVKCVGDGSVQEARLDAWRGMRWIEDLSFAKRQRRFALAKGETSARARRLIVGGAVWLSPRVPVEGGFVVRFRDGSRVFGWHLQLALHPRERASLVVGAGYVLPWIRAVQIEIGLVAGGGWVEPRPNDLVLRGQAVLGQYVGLDWRVSERAVLAARVDVQQLFTVQSPAPPALAVTLSLGVGVDLLPGFVGSGI